MTPIQARPRYRTPNTEHLRGTARDAHEMRRRVSSDAVVSSYINELAARPRDPRPRSSLEHLLDPAPGAARGRPQRRPPAGRDRPPLELAA
jgi:hypothetical protein